MQLRGVHPGEYSLCADSARVATVAVVTSPLCQFGDGAGSPCQDPVCGEDLFSEPCQQLLLQYCTDRPEDHGCELIAPVTENSSRAPLV